MKKYCLNCGKELTKELILKGNKFCCHSCSVSYNNKIIERNISNLVNNFSDEEFIDIINNSNTMKEIHTKLGYKRVGSCTKAIILRRCDSLNIELKVKETPNPSYFTKKELFDKRSSWLSARTEFRKQAAKNFKESGKEYKCAVCGYNKHVDIAHIKAVSDFSDDTLVSEISKSDNLIALCPNHHWEYDHGLLDITPYI